MDTKTIKGILIGFVFALILVGAWYLGTKQGPSIEAVPSSVPVASPKPSAPVASERLNAANELSKNSLTDEDQANIETALQMLEDMHLAALSCQSSVMVYLAENENYVSGAQAKAPKNPEPECRNRLRDARKNADQIVEKLPKPIRQVVTDYYAFWNSSFTALQVEGDESQERFTKRTNIVIRHLNELLTKAKIEIDPYRPK